MTRSTWPVLSDQPFQRAHDTAHQHGLRAMIGDVETLAGERIELHAYAAAWNPGRNEATTAIALAAWRRRLNPPRERQARLF